VGGSKKGNRIDLNTCRHAVWVLGMQASSLQHTARGTCTCSTPTNSLRRCSTQYGYAKYSRVLWTLGTLGSPCSTWVSLSVGQASVFCRLLSDGPPVVDCCANCRSLHLRRCCRHMEAAALAAAGERQRLDANAVDFQGCRSCRKKGFASRPRGRTRDSGVCGHG